LLGLGRRQPDSEQFSFAPRTRPSFDGKLIVRTSARAICDPRRSAMKQQAAEERWDWAGDIMEVGLYSGLILVAALLWVYIPA